jgi:hypothetical protein
MRKDEPLRWRPALANLPNRKKPMTTEQTTPEKLTDAEIDAFDQSSREQFERTLRLSQALRQAWKEQPPEEPKPGSDEAKEAIKDAIKQGAKED